MADGWIDGCEWRVGRNANYASGRIDAQGGVGHETVGRESTAIGDNGYFHFLVHDEVGRAPSQFAQVWCVTFHACEWNRTTVGIEVERFPGEPMKPEQLFWCQYLVRAIAAETGNAIRAEWKGDVLVVSPYDMGGQWANHGALQIRACDPHSDGWTPEEWAIITSEGQPGGPASGTEPQEDTMRLIQNTDNEEWFLFTDYGWESGVSKDRVAALAFGGHLPTGGMPGGDIFALAVSINKMKETLFGQMKTAGLGGTTTTSPSAPVDPAVLHTIVREELNKTKLTG